MRSTTLVPVGLTVLLIGVIGAAGAVILDGRGPTPAPTVNPRSGSDLPPAERPRFDAPEEGTTYVGPAFVGPYTTPTSDVAQSKLWHAEGQWWGLLLNEESAWTIHRLNWRTQTWEDTEVFVDERVGASGDALWTGSALYVVAAGTDRADPQHAPRLSRYSPHDVSGFALDPGFPILLDHAGVQSITIAADSTGRLWTAFVADGEMRTAHTLDDDRRWSEPAKLPSDGATMLDGDESVAVVSYRDRVGVLWSNQVRESFWFASRSDASEPGVWGDADEIYRAGHAADDHVSVTVGPEGQILAVVKSGFNDLAPRPPNAPGILLLALSNADTWSQHVVTRVRDSQTRPIVVVDTERDYVHVFTADSGGGTVFRKTARIADLGFAEGAGEIAIQLVAHASATQPTSAKQPVDAGSGMVVLASDRRTQRYLHWSSSLGGTDPGTGPEPPPLEHGEIRLVDDRFDAGPTAATQLAGWRLAEVGAFTTTADGAESPVGAILGTLAGAGDARVCKDLPHVEQGRMRLEASVRLSGEPRAAVELASVRGGGRVLATVRLAPGGVASFFDHQTRVDVAGAHAPGTWYRSIVDIDFESRTYAWELRDLASGAMAVQVPSAAWVSPQSASVDRLCLEVKADAGVELQFDDVVVTRDVGEPAAAQP